MKRRRSKWLALGLALSVIVTAVFIARLDWAEFRATIANVKWSWVAGSAVAIALSITIRSARWLGISGAKVRQLGAYWNSTIIGYVGNVLYPGRAGEVLRIAALHHALRLPPGDLMSKAVVDRMADVVFLGLAAFYVAGIATRNIGSEALFASMVVIIAVPVVAFVVFLLLGAHLKPLVNRLASFLPGLWRDRVPRWYGQMLAACAEMANPRRLGAASALTLLAYGVDYTSFWLFLRAFDWPLSMNAAMTTAVLVAIGSVLPAAPGNIGIYQAACVIGLGAYGIAESSALAFSVVAQGSTIVVIGILGTIVAARYGMGFGLARRSE